MTHSLELYVELYKRGIYDKIPLGQYPNGELFYPTLKQIKAFEYLNDDTTTFIGYGGAARCFTGDTLVMTKNGHVPIKDIVCGDYVLSIDVNTGIRSYKRVLNKYVYNLAEPPKMAIFANGIKCTHDHEFLFRGEWTKANELEGRVMETHRENLLCVQYGEGGYIKPLWKRETEINEASKRQKRVSKNGFLCGWKAKNSESSPISGNSIYRKQFKSSNCKSQKLYKNRQQGGEFRVDEPKGKYSTRNKRRVNGVQVFKRSSTTKGVFKKRFGQWNVNINRAESNRDKTEIQTKSLYKSHTSQRIRSFRGDNKRCSITQFLGSREITESEILGIRYDYLNDAIYDLNVADNHNYTVTKDNIIVHNSGKTVLECTAMILECLGYNGIGWGLARKELTTLKRTVLLSLFRQFEFYGVSSQDYNYNQQLNRIDFNNGSTIFLIDTAYRPSDPLNTRFGGFELTRVAIDESNETDLQIINKLFERTGWRKNDTYNLKRKQFECFNPAKNHVYTRFYTPFRDNKETPFKKFIPALPADNPHPSVKEWISDIVATGDRVTIERQVYGNFDYDDDPSALCDYNSICDLFTNTHVKPDGKTKISADLAMQGRDRFVAGHWDGLVAYVDIDDQKSSGKEIETKLNELKNEYLVKNSDIVADSDGLGAYLDSYIVGMKTFHGGGRAKNTKEFANLKAECSFKLAEFINQGKILIRCTSEQEERIKDEISVCLKRAKINGDDQKKRIISKDEMKEKLGHSPDYLDFLIMGMYFYVRPNNLLVSSWD